MGFSLGRVSPVTRVLGKPPLTQLTEGLAQSLGRRSPCRRAWHTRQYSCLETPMGTGVWWAADHGVTERQTRLSS